VIEPNASRAASKGFSSSFIILLTSLITLVNDIIANVYGSIRFGRLRVVTRWSLGVDRHFEQLRSDARFQELIRKVDLPV
jgi:hypothetical protein